MIKVDLPNFIVQKAFSTAIRLLLPVGISISLFAAPFGGDIEAALRLDELMAKPRESRSLTPAEAEKYLDLAQDTSNLSSQVLAVLLLGYDTSAESLQLLADVAIETENTLTGPTYAHQRLDISCRVRHTAH